MGERSKALEPIVYESEASEATPEVRPARTRPLWGVSIVALVVAAVSVTLLVTDVEPPPGGPEPIPASATSVPGRNAEAIVSCEAGDNGEWADPAQCAQKATDRVNDLCADPTLDAVALTLHNDYRGPARYGTFVCDDERPIHVSPPGRTVEVIVSCDADANGDWIQPETCGLEATQQVNEHCADLTVEAVVVTFRSLEPVHPFGSTRYGTVVCDDPTPIVPAERPARTYTALGRQHDP